MLFTKSIVLLLVASRSSFIVIGRPLGANSIKYSSRAAREINSSFSTSDIAEYITEESLPEHRIDIRSPQEAGDQNTIEQPGMQESFNSGFGNALQGGLGQLFGRGGGQNGLGGSPGIGSGGLGGLESEGAGGGGFGQALSGFGGGSGFNFDQIGGELIKGLGNILGGAFTSMASNRRNSFFGNLF